MRQKPVPAAFVVITLHVIRLIITIVVIIIIPNGVFVFVFNTRTTRVTLLSQCRARPDDDDGTYTLSGRGDNIYSVRSDIHIRYNARSDNIKRRVVGRNVRGVDLDEISRPKERRARV